MRDVCVRPEPTRLLASAQHLVRFLLSAPRLSSCLSRSEISKLSGDVRIRVTARL